MELQAVYKQAVLACIIFMGRYYFLSLNISAGVIDFRKEEHLTALTAEALQYMLATLE